MRFAISTDDFPERDRLGVWASTLRANIGLDAEPLPGITAAFQGRLSGRTGGSLLNLRVHAGAHRVMRRERDIAGPSGYWIYRETAEGAWFRHAGQEFVTRMGELIIYDADAPFETCPSREFGLETWLIPRDIIAPHLPSAGRPLAMSLSGRSGVDALAVGYLEGLTQAWDTIPNATMGQVADTLCRLIGIAAGAVAEEQGEAVRAGRLTEAKRRIGRQLADPNLSAPSLAASLGLSVRSLHSLFEPTGTSFARYVLRRRLEECRTALLNHPARPVTDIAFAWGFGSLSSFYRAFQAAFGIAPGDLRAAAREDRAG